MSAVPRRLMMQMYQLASGRRFLTRLDELNRTQWLSREDLLALQRTRLRRMLAYAYQHVPYYHRLFDQCRFDPNDVLTSMASFHELPLLTKGLVRENFEAIQTTESSRRKQFTEQSTTGSTGHPLVLMQDSSFRDYVTADAHRHLGWAGWKLGDVHCFIWSARGGMEAAAALRTKLMNWALNRFITSTLTLSEENMAAFAAQIRRRRPRILHSFPSALYRFGQFVRDRGIDDIKFDAVMAGAETLYPEQRRFIEDVFGGRVFNRYGSVEVGGIACECGAHEGMHASIENCYVEILKDGRHAEPGEVGDVVVTSLHNYGMPFIRYSMEDLAAWSTHDSCPCGRGLPVMKQLQGRSCDTFKTKDGRTIGGSTAGNLFGIKGIKQFQVIQKTLDLVVVRIVKDSDFDPAEMGITERMLKTLLKGDVEVRFEFPDHIPVQPSGKHRYAISEVTDHTSSTGGYDSRLVEQGGSSLTLRHR